MFEMIPFAKRNSVYGYNPFRELDNLEKAFFGPYGGSQLAAFRTESPYCFPSGAATAGHGTVQGLERAVKKIISKDLILLHGWRTTFLTFAQEHGWPRKLCDELISHKQGSAVTLAYDRAKYLPQKRALVQWHADFLDAVRTGGEIPVMPEGIVGRFQY